MAPIRTAIIGLSSSSSRSWAAGAHLPYLVSGRGREKYTITALCNSSIESARKAIKLHNLNPETTKAYGDPKEVAEDPDIDLVVCCTRVDVHYSTILPSIQAGKAVFVEWPLAHDLEHATKLAEAAKKSGARTMINVQGRVAPPILRMRQVVESGCIGKVVSSEVRASGGVTDRQTLPQFLDYFLDRSIGGNIFTIGFGHTFDQVQFVLGDVENIKANLTLQRPLTKIKDAATQEIIGTKTSDVPDLIVLSASLPESPTVQDKASILFRCRRGQAFKGEAPMVWTVSGEKGELRLVAWGGPAINALSYSAPLTIEVHDFATDEVENIEWSFDSWQNELPVFARNVAKMYDNFADGKSADVPTIEDALKRHQQLEEIIVSGYNA